MDRLERVKARASFWRAVFRELRRRFAREHAVVTHGLREWGLRPAKAVGKEHRPKVIKRFTPKPRWATHKHVKPAVMFILRG